MLWIHNPPKSERRPLDALLNDSSRLSVTPPEPPSCYSARMSTVFFIASTTPPFTGKVNTVAPVAEPGMVHDLHITGLQHGDERHVVVEEAHAAVHTGNGHALGLALEKFLVRCEISTFVFNSALAASAISFLPAVVTTSSMPLSS